MSDKELSDFLKGKTEYTLELFRFFIDEFNKIGPVELQPLKSMIAIKGKNKIAYVTQLGKNFVHVVIPFNVCFEDNLCFTKIAQVFGTNQYNHHLRLYFNDDINTEVKSYLNKAYSEEY
ncbi:MULTISPECIES: DUF5655 domain-containing protein [unclassified Pedobacter]|uniref:DUF5655 domain-containing protein n=1 Tax=unclassified Pedobacter TaxID=2628915 RepID=UPI001E4E3AA9|nr:MULTISPECIES: DUF5655 domain-containing protein [unclassified Pedobacter]